MQKFTGKITDIMPVSERGEWASVQFRVEETEGQYPQACLFTKSAKDDNKKWIESFEKDNPVGSVVEVDYRFKSNAWKHTFINDVVAFKVVNLFKGKDNKSESVPQERFNSMAESTSKHDEPMPMDDSLDLPF